MSLCTMHTTYTQGQLNRIRDWFIYVSSGRLQIFFLNVFLSSTYMHCA